MVFSDFSINLDTNRMVFYPGETISGSVVVDINRQIQMGGIKIKFVGQAKCHWTEKEWEGEGEDRKQVTRHIKGKEKFFEFKTNLYDTTSGHYCGRNSYPFVFTLPQNLPSSFEALLGNIRYELKAEIDLPGRKDLKTRKPITINEIIDTNHPQYQKTPGGEVHKEVGCLCWKAGPLTLSANIDRECYCPGELILINAQVQNNTNRDMKAMKAKIIQKIEYKAEGNKQRQETSVVARLDGPQITAGKFATWASQPLGIPATLPTITKSKVIRVTYLCKVEIDVPWGFDPTIEMPIVMGTVPYRVCYGAPQQYGLPQEEMPIPDSNFNNTPQMPPAPSNILGYADMAPPAYAAVVGSNQVNVHHKDKYELFGSANYQPVYTFAQPYQGTMRIEQFSAQPGISSAANPPPIYPSQQPGYPPKQPGYPPQQPEYAPHSGYPPQQPGYPPQHSGYPPQQPGFAS